MPCSEKQNSLLFLLCSIMFRDESKNIGLKELQQLQYLTYPVTIQNTIYYVDHKEHVIQLNVKVDGFCQLRSISILVK